MEGLRHNVARISADAASLRINEKCPNCVKNKVIILKYTKLTDLLCAKMKKQSNQSSMSKSMSTSSGEGFVNRIQELDQSNISDHISSNDSQDKSNEGFHEHSEDYEQMRGEIKKLQEVIEKLKGELQKATRENEVTCKLYRQQIEKDRCNIQISKQQKEACLNAIRSVEKRNILLEFSIQDFMTHKARFMHIRYAVYALLKMLAIEDQIQADPNIYNTLLVLNGLFEFSTDEKEEMYSKRKIKHRKKNISCGEEASYITVACL